MSKEWVQVEQELKEPFAYQYVEWRVGATSKDKTKGIALAYICNDVIQNRLDEVFGISNWKNEFKEWKGKGVLCGLSCRLEGGEWLTKWDGADETEKESTKGGLSNSMKRAALQWGIGRYLKNLSVTWVDIEPNGKSYVIKRGCEPKLPGWALPKEQDRSQGDTQGQSQQEQPSANQGAPGSQQNRSTEGRKSQQGQSQQGQARQNSSQNQSQGASQGGKRGTANNRQAQSKTQVQSTNSSSQGQPDQNNPAQSGQNIASIVSFSGLVRLVQEPKLEKKQTENGLTDRISILGFTKEGQKAVIVGWGVEMIEYLADLSEGQVLKITEAKAMESNGVLKIQVEARNFEVMGDQGVA